MSQRLFFKRMSSLLVGGSLCLAALAASGFAQSEVTLDVNAAVNLVQKQMYGSLMERLGRQWGGPATGNTIVKGAIWVGTSSTIPNINGMRKDVLDGLKECGLGSAQWPGGCAALNYNWDPPNPSNEVGTDRFLEFCQYVGCEPLFAGPHATTAANSNLYWIKHIDSVTAKRGMDSLRWFKVGNEVWGGCASHVDSATYCTYFKAHYAKIHPYRASVKLEAGHNNEDRGFNAVAMWEKTVIKTLDTLMDGLEYHDYVFRTWYPSDAISMAQYWRVMDDGLVGDFAGHMRTNIIPVLDSIDPNKRIKLIVDEWGDWFAADNWMQKAMLLDGLSAANQLHLMMGYSDRITVACLAQGVNVIHSLINIDTFGVMTKTPTFYVFKMFKPHHERGAKWVPATTSNIQTFVQSADMGSVTLPVVNVGSTVDSFGRVNISVCNIDVAATRQITINLTSNNISQYGIDSAQIVTGPTVTSSNPFGGAEVVNLQNFDAANYALTNNGKTLTATMPAKSVVMFRLKPTVGVQTGSIQVHGSHAFSVKNGSRGAVLISSTTSKKTPVTISLYGVNGRTLLNKVSRTFEPGTSSFALANGHCDNGVYIVKIVGEDVNFSQKVVVGK